MASYLWLLFSFIKAAFWRGRGKAGSWGLFAGWAGYQATLQLNFTALPAAVPFWIFAGSALLLWREDPPSSARVFQLPSLARLASAAGVMVVVLLAVPALVTPPGTPRPRRRLPSRPLVL